MLDLTMPAQNITVNTSMARNDTSGSCGCTSGNDVFYRFTLTQPEIIFADTFGATWDTSLFLQSSTGTNVTAATGFTTCSDDTTECSQAGRQSVIFAKLDAGTYFISVGGCGQGAFTLRFQHIPDTEGSFFYGTRITGESSDETFLIGTNRHSSHCGGTISGEDVRWFVTCGGTRQFFSMCEGDGGGYLSRNNATETRRWDPVLYIHSGVTGIESSCSDTGAAGVDCRGRVGANLSSATFDTVQGGARFSMASASRGINAILVDERNRGSGMAYRLRWRVTDR